MRVARFVELLLGVIDLPTQPRLFILGRRLGLRRQRPEPLPLLRQLLPRQVERVRRVLPRPPKVRRKPLVFRIGPVLGAVELALELRPHAVHLGLRPLHFPLVCHHCVLLVRVHALLRVSQLRPQRAVLALQNKLIAERPAPRLLSLHADAVPLRHRGGLLFAPLTLCIQVRLLKLPPKPLASAVHLRLHRSPRLKPCVVQRRRVLPSEVLQITAHIGPLRLVLPFRVADSTLVLAAQSIPLLGRPHLLPTRLLPRRLDDLPTVRLGAVHRRLQRALGIELAVLDGAHQILPGLHRLLQLAGQAGRLLVVLPPRHHQIFLVLDAQPLQVVGVLRLQSLALFSERLLHLRRSVDLLLGKVDAGLAAHLLKLHLRFLHQ